MAGMLQPHSADYRSAVQVMPAMANVPIIDANSFSYRSGLSKLEEAVISSHFMEILAKDPRLQLYSAKDFSSRHILLESRLVEESLLPTLLCSSRRFAEQRAQLAGPRARLYFQKHGVARPQDIRVEHEIAEAVFDKQYLRGPRETCSRQAISSKVRLLIEQGQPIRMVIPALPFKFSSPLKTRGHGPDLGEINFLLSLVEIAWTVEILYKKGRGSPPGPLAQFIVVSDGSRFASFVGEPTDRLDKYQEMVQDWVRRLGLENYVSIVDYLEVLRARLPKDVFDAKTTIASKARVEYSERMWPVLNPNDMSTTFKMAATVEPDPELNNREGRFVALLKSLVFTITYRTLINFAAVHSPRGRYEEYYSSLYRELTGHMFVSYGVGDDHRSDIQEAPVEQTSEDLPVRVKEGLRIAMLTEAWQATIDYLAEIKSDRELPTDPISVVFSDCLRWTIHAKPGQLALLTSHALGIPIQCWAGSGTFRRSKSGKIRLCTLPVLALEGQGAIPVITTNTGPVNEPLGQPLFYLDPCIGEKDMLTFLSTLGDRLTRLRST